MVHHQGFERNVGGLLAQFMLDYDFRSIPQKEAAKIMRIISTIVSVTAKAPIHARDVSNAF